MAGVSGETKRGWRSVHARRPAKMAAAALGATALSCAVGAAVAPAKLRAPKPVPAWYMTAASATDLVRQAKSSACTFAKRQPKGRRLMLFDFGAARKYDDGTFGADLREIHEFRNGEILKALQKAAQTYRRCHRRGGAIIAYGNTNSMPGNMSPLDAQQAGIQQALTVRKLRRFQHHRHRYNNQGAAAAGDIEPGFGYPAVSRALVDGADETAYYDFGNAGGCPGQPGSTRCYNGWELEDLGEVSMGGRSRPLPEIYRGYEASQWARVQDRWDGRYSFAGVTGAPTEPLAPKQGWKRLARRADRVGRELVSIGETPASLAGPAPGKRVPAIGSAALPGQPMTVTTPAHLVPRPEGFFSTSVIYPLVNEWVASDRRRFVAVDAGADPLHPSTGVLGIFRQNYPRVSQAQRVVKVPRAGAIELTGAPLGRARAALGAPSTRLAFDGARGVTGTLDLSDGSVRLTSTGAGR